LIQTVPHSPLAAARRAADSLSPSRRASSFLRQPPARPGRHHRLRHDQPAAGPGL